MDEHVTNVLLGVFIVGAGIFACTLDSAGWVAGLIGFAACMIGFIIVAYKLGAMSGLDGLFDDDEE